MKKILVPVDGSENVLKALKMGLEVAEKYDAKVEVLCVAPKNPLNDVVVLGLEEESAFVRENINEALASSNIVVDAAKSLVAEANVEAEFEIKVGEPAEVILSEAKEQAVDCIVMGCRGLSGLKQLLLGSVSNQVVNGAEVPVLVVK